MLTTGKRYLVFQEVDSLEAIRRKLEKISAEDLRETANEILDSKNLNTLIFE